MKRRILSILSAICLILTLVPTTAFAKSFGDFEYNVYGDEVTIIGYNGNDTDVNIPASINSYSVTAIEYYAFYNCTSIESIHIPNSVTSIGDGAFFSCTSLTSIEIPSSVIDIGILVFTKCTSLTDITVDENNTAYSSVDGVLFNKDKSALISYPLGKSAASYSMPDSVNYIGEFSFSYCANLKSIDVPNNVTFIGGDAFYGCENLESIFLPDKDNLSIIANSIPNTASQVKYSIDETKNKVTVTEITLGTDKASVAVPAEICGCPVIAVVKSEQPKVGEHTCVSDGTENCSTKAICTIAGEEYGEVDNTKHNLEKISAKAATVTEAGNKEYWHCLNCGRYFSDRNGTNEIKLADTIIQKLQPEIIDGNSKSISNDKKSPETGNNGNTALILAFLLYCGGILFVTGAYGKIKKEL